jgi:AraC-like DNA-binding protein
MNKATAIIHKNLSDSSFGIDDFASEMAMSRSQLFRKFVRITGKAPSDFIRCIRLMRAANLIEQRFGNITEIALEVGYNNLAHFAHCFRGHFGILPSDYAKKISRN